MEATQAESHQAERAEIDDPAKEYLSPVASEKPEKTYKRMPFIPSRHRLPTIHEDELEHQYDSTPTKDKTLPPQSTDTKPVAIQNPAEDTSKQSYKMASAIAYQGGPGRYRAGSCIARNHLSNFDEHRRTKGHPLQKNIEPVAVEEMTTDVAPANRPGSITHGVRIP
ncbi:hypothetical protein ABW21_db0207255 [Orbilia brochopaga]|nr:hypothetical protein ABW21_db0207255 [Drechslerella brochopaga]